jgi:hypothetical protein
MNLKDCFQSKSCLKVWSGTAVSSRVSDEKGAFHWKT